MCHEYLVVYVQLTSAQGHAKQNTNVGVENLEQNQQRGSGDIFIDGSVRSLPGLVLG